MPTPKALPLAIGPGARQSVSGAGHVGGGEEGGGRDSALRPPLAAAAAAAIDEPRLGRRSGVWQIGMEQEEAVGTLEVTAASEVAVGAVEVSAPEVTTSEVVVGAVEVAVEEVSVGTVEVADGEVMTVKVGEEGEGGARPPRATAPPPRPPAAVDGGGSDKPFPARAAAWASGSLQPGAPPLPAERRTAVQVRRLRAGLQLPVGAGHPQAQSQPASAPSSAPSAARASSTPPTC
ncbi:myosin-1-like [Amblyraja radiata]|uniref:myosin-1-like n=1 Tax=Amblyraja radiata TaxID=386614 RepID=UPI0014033DAF|nr:myosin-1-like [Amblyraja radiata]